MIDDVMNQGTAGWLIFFVYVVFAPVLYAILAPVIYFCQELSDSHYFHIDWSHEHLEVEKTQISTDDEVAVEEASVNQEKSVAHLSSKLTRAPSVVATLSYKQSFKNFEQFRKLFEKKNENENATQDVKNKNEVVLDEQL